MRLTRSERTAITDTIHALDSQAKIYLFGSRVDDSKKGGDIDLLVVSSLLGFSDKRRIKVRLYELIGEQKIDLLLTKDTSKAFVRIALEEGILL